MNKQTFLFSLSLMVIFITGTGNAETWVKNVELLASAQPQECYTGQGTRANPVSTEPFVCPANSTPYTPQTYVWSLTQYKNSLWFGTGANILCTTQGALMSEVDPSEGRTSVCEYGESWIFQSFPNLPAQYGDWRPPKIYRYDLNTKKLVDRTPYSDKLINSCFGLRSAGTHNGVVFFAGGKIGTAGVIMFAFNADTGKYLGSRQFAEYRTIRKWLVVNDQLYTGMGTDNKGSILRWMGSVSDPWNFIVVGSVNGAIRELAEYIDGQGKSRVAVTARGVFLSPAIEGSGLIAEQSTSWISIWNPNQYDPDWVTRSTYVGGGLEYLNGWLYFGTMHIPGNAADIHQTCILNGTTLASNICFGAPQNLMEQLAIYSGTARATSIWRIKNAEIRGQRVTQLLYGEAQLPAYDEATRSFPLVNNLGGYTPLLGSSGFNSVYNNYAWVMEVADNKLFVGTMDYSALRRPNALDAGADLWRIDGTADDVPVAAVAETTNAFGEPDFPTYAYRPYGFRCLIKSPDGTKLFAGMASGVNLGAVGDGAGWQLLQLDSVAPAIEIPPSAGE